jgi:hypothetical protein
MNFMLSLMKTGELVSADGQTNVQTHLTCYYSSENVRHSFRTLESCNVTVYHAMKVYYGGDARHIMDFTRCV